MGTSKTCSETNPHLFYPVKYFIYEQILFAVITTMIFSITFTAILFFFASMDDRAKVGCKAAVYKLPKVPRGSHELIDTEDNQIMECPICQESLECASSVVCTPCSHYFHEDCLATWCKNHLDCPMCRKPVGE